MESLAHFVAFGLLTLFVMALVVLYEQSLERQPEMPMPVTWEEGPPCLDRSHSN